MTWRQMNEKNVKYFGWTIHRSHLSPFLWLISICLDDLKRKRDSQYNQIVIFSILKCLLYFKNQQSFSFVWKMLILYFFMLA